MKLIDQDILTQYYTSGKEEIAFGRLVSEYKERVYWHVRKMVLNHEDANDITQNTFIKIWRGLPKFKRESNLYTWIYRIATNEALNFIQANKKRIAQSIEDIQLDNRSEESFFSGEEIKAKLYKAISTLPQKQKLVFHMKYFNDLTYNEMAEILGGSVGSLKASYHHAHKKIESYLSNHD